MVHQGNRPGTPNQIARNLADRNLPRKLPENPVPEPVVRKPPRHRPGTYIGRDPIAKAVGEKLQEFKETNSHCDMSSGGMSLCNVGIPNLKNIRDSQPSRFSTCFNSGNL